MKANSFFKTKQLKRRHQENHLTDNWGPITLQLPVFLLGIWFQGLNGKGVKMQKGSCWCVFPALMDFGAMPFQNAWAQRARDCWCSSKPHLELLNITLMWLLHFQRTFFFFLWGINHSLAMSPFYKWEDQGLKSYWTSLMHGSKFSRLCITFSSSQGLWF